MGNRLLTAFFIIGVGVSSAAAAAWVVTTDYGNFGRIRSVAETTPWAVSADLAIIPGDAVARLHGGRLYVVGRGGANLLQVYDPSGGLVLLHEFSLGTGLNPQDIAFDASGAAYVSCYDQAVLLRVDVATESVVASYSTAAFADADGLPETAWMQVVGDRLYISCQKLDRNNWYAPTGPGQLLVFDMTQRVFLTPVDLVGSDPYTQIEVLSGGRELRLGCAGFFGLADGGIEAVDTVTGLSLGFLVDEAALGGDVTAFVTTGPDALHVLVSDASNVTSLQRYQVSTGQMSLLATGNGYVYADLAYDADYQLYVADRTPGTSGLRVFDTSSGAELTTGVLPTGLPPFQIILPTAGSTTPVLPLTRRGDLALSAPFPNPCNPRAACDLSGRPGAAVRLSVFDLQGHRLQQHIVLLDQQGRGDWVFNGEDSRGRALPTGVYRLVAQSGAGFATRSLTLVK